MAQVSRKARIKMTTAITFHVHLVSDSTGETINAIAKAAGAQFDDIEPVEHLYALVRSEKQLARVLDSISENQGIVLFSLVNDELCSELECYCRGLNVPCIPVMDQVLVVYSTFLGRETTHRPGAQHQLDAEYFNRMDAMAYTMAHDDGQNMHDLEGADILLLGVSRTSKTPTCIYLGNRGMKAANIPLAFGFVLPDEIKALDFPLIVGLVAAPERLVQVRRNRLLSLHQDVEADYINPEIVRDELSSARRLFQEIGCPVIDVTRRSIEETAAAILNLHRRKWEEHK